MTRVSSRFDDEGHGFVKKTNCIEASEAYLAFLDKYLTGAKLATNTTTGDTPVPENGNAPSEATSGSTVATPFSLCAWSSLVAMLSAAGMMR